MATIFRRAAKLRLAVFALILTTFQMVILVPVMSRLKTEKPLGPVYARADIEAGKAVYADKCAACHGTVGQGAPEMVAIMPGADIRAAVTGSPAALSHVIRNGKGTMPPFNTLTDEEMRQLVSYLKTLSTEE